MGPDVTDSEVTMEVGDIILYSIENMDGFVYDDNMEQSEMDDEIYDISKAFENI